MEISKESKCYFQLLIFGAVLGWSVQTAAQDRVDEVIETGIERNAESKESQARIDKTAEQIDTVVAKYKKELKVIEGLKVYNSLLQRQLDDQHDVIEQLKDSINEVAVVQRQITPLMLRMVEGLDQFIQLEVPFRMDERKKRIQRLRETIERSDVEAAEKFRNVLEAYQIEGEYGRTIESYSGTLEVNGKTLNVDFLKIGRVALLYQSEGGELNGAWDQKNRTWVELDPADYRSNISIGLKIARKQVAPDLIMVPVQAPEDL